ncbi:MAG TPA: AmmeMemoRadiSam system protein A [Phycisphaerae bacterium]|nr:AmmeMemoRadiSam system protein A [Phycisphaerae bacterium]
MTISAEDRSRLVALAREAVEAKVSGKPLPRPDRLDGLLGEVRGCFVTLTNQGRLRGCIGTFSPTQPLGRMLVEMAAAAARDPRFVTNPITPDEVGQLDVQVSVLSPLEETKDPEGLQVGTHGIYVTNGYRSGCFLPEVATDQGWNAAEFLSCCCEHKAGLPPDAWRMLDTKVYLFTSEKFSE